MKFIDQNDLKLSLKEKGKTHRVLLKNISHIQCESYLSTVYFINEKKPITVAKLLKKFEEELSIYGFIRICRNTLVNIKNVELIHNKTRIITMTGGNNLTISYRNYKKINNILNG